MRTTLLLAVVAAIPAYLAAQGLPVPNVIYQQAGVLAGGPPAPGPFFLSSAAIGPAVTGKPFSGTEQRHSLQVLGDGTRIERTDTDQYYRDSEGRTRVEQTSGNNPVVTINDPVAGFMVTLNPADKTAHKLPMPAGMPVGAKVVTAAGGGGFSASGGVVTQQAIKIRAGGSVGFDSLDGPPPNITIMQSEALSATPAKEDLGTQFLNGVSAQGSRTTLTIPAGQIGNDRDLHVVSERWYSQDLQMTLKSVNNDPRFGETTFELTNINRGAPDPSLFTIPTDYTVSQPQAMQFKDAPLK